MRWRLRREGGRGWCARLPIAAIEIIAVIPVGMFCQNARGRRFGAFGRPRPSSLLALAVEIVAAFDLGSFCQNAWVDGRGQVSEGIASDGGGGPP